MTTRRLTTAQALVAFLANQSVERDDVEQPFFAGVFGIFGHGNLAGIGQALQQAPRPLRYYPARNEQAMVHLSAAFAKMKNRLETFACTTSIGPGATNMVTAAAGATINRLPVLLLPGDIFATRKVAPVLQQLESPWSQDLSVNDALKPVSRYWDRINRPEQLVTSLLEAMRTLTDQADTGAVTLALPQDVQAEAWDFPADWLAPRTWRIPRPLPDEGLLQRAADVIRAARRPLLIAGGGVIYSEACGALQQFAEATGIPVAETQAGKGALSFNHPSSLGAIGVTGTPGANIIARDADVVIGVGTRYSDFTTASKTSFRNPDVHFVNINLASFDALKHAATPLGGDARASLQALAAALRGYQVPQAYREHVAALNREWDQRVERIYHLGNKPLPSQGEVIGAVNDAAGLAGVVVGAAGSIPGDLHKLWRTRDPKGYHLEYGYSCMGYELAGGLGVKLADPSRDVYVMVGDASWLMLPSEIVTSIQEGVKLTVVLINNHGYASIGGLSQALGSDGFGTQSRYRDERGDTSGPHLPIDFAANAASLGAHAIRAESIEDLRVALAEAKGVERTTVITIETDADVQVGNFESWWDVPVAEISTMDSVRAARLEYAAKRATERYYI